MILKCFTKNTHSMQKKGIKRGQKRHEAYRKPKVKQETQIQSLNNNIQC